MTVNIRQAIVASLKFIGQLFVINPQAMEDGCMQVMDWDRRFGNIKTVLICFAMGMTCFYPTASHPDAEAAWVVVSTIFF